MVEDDFGLILGGATNVNIAVCSMIGTTPEEDRETYDLQRKGVEDVQDFLREKGIEVDLLSKPNVEAWGGSIERFHDLYQLRRLAAHLERGNDVGDILNEDDTSDQDLVDILDEDYTDDLGVDALLASIWDKKADTRFPHLINHTGGGSYYLPADFSEPIFIGLGDDDDEEAELVDTTVSLGSSNGLLRELTEIEALLDGAAVPEGGARRALQALKTAAQQSIDHGLPISLW